MANTKNSRAKFLGRGVSMHKSSHSMSKRAHKKMNKEVRKANQMPLEAAPDFAETIQKRQNLYQKFLLAARKKFSIKVAKLHGKHSKRTTPGNVSGTGNPQSFHGEGKQWIATTRKQQVDRANKLRRKMLKKI